LFLKEDMMDEQARCIETLIELHRGTPRQGPGDIGFSEHILTLLPDLPDQPRIADLGCGTGVAALHLAERFQVKVRAVDFARGFLEELEKRARQRGLGHLVDIVEADMGTLDWPRPCLDLIWSEGAAYILTFEGALKAWHPLLVPGGVAVISELSYFKENVAQPVRDFFDEGYPTAGTEAENSAIAQSCGFEIIGTHRLPTQAWWDNYYGPLKKRMKIFEDSDDPVMQAVLQESTTEMELLRDHGSDYGYSFYILKAV
jgi:SAM-dependent methyltransferase